MANVLLWIWKMNVIHVVAKFSFLITDTNDLNKILYVPLQRVSNASKTQYPLSHIHGAKFFREKYIKTPYIV